MQMDIIIILGLLILGCLLNLIWEPGFGPANKVAKIYLALSIVLAGMVWLFYFAGIKNPGVLDSLLPFLGPRRVRSVVAIHRFCTARRRSSPQS